MMSFCPTGKQSYPTPNAAWAVLNHIKARGRHCYSRVKTTQGEVYRCAECSGWHITRHSQTARRREVAANGYPI